MMFMDTQYQIVDKYAYKEEYKQLKVRFHVVLGKREEEILSLVKIVRVIHINKDVLFEGVLQNFRFQAVRANNVVFNFSVADFPLMNIHDLITVGRILKGVDVSRL